MKFSNRDKALLIFSLFCVAQFSYAQNLTNNYAPVGGVAPSFDLKEPEPPRETVQVVHIERPIALTLIENENPESFSEQFATATQAPLQLNALTGTQLTPEQQSYLERLKDIESFDQVLEDLEIQGDAWSLQIAEELTTLGDLLQAQGQFEQSIEFYDRALHVNRVNNGLFSASQVPLVEKIVQGHVAQGQWREADERKQYAFYVQTRAFRIDDPRMIDVYDNLARWNMATFYRGVDEDSSQRLLQTYLLYRTASESVATHFGKHDPRYIPFLRREASAVDMLRRYSSPDESNGAHLDSELRLSSEFIGESMGSVDRNNAGIEALEKIVEFYSDPSLPPTQANSVAQAQAIAELADWYLINNRRQAAMRTYEEAYELIASEENSSELLQQTFGGIVFLPTFSSFNEQRKEAFGIGADSGWRMGHVDIAFDVNQYGRLSNFEILDLVPNDIVRADIQVLNSIRTTLVRPKIRDGETVSSDLERYRFNFWY